MSFKLKSGNKPQFKQVGSSPVKQKYDLSKATVDGKHPQTEKNKKYKDVDSKDLFLQGKTRDKDGNVKDIQWAPGPRKRPKVKKSPAKQKLNKGGEAQDQNKIFNNKGEHVGNYVNGKKVMLSAHGQINDAKREAIRDMEINSRKKSPAKQAKGSGLGPRTSFGGVKNPELVKDKKKPFSKKVMKDGPKNRVHGVKNPGNWQPHQFRDKKSPAKQTDATYADGSKKSKREQDFSKRHTAEKAKDKYWYKIDGKKATKAQYLKYENKPGNMEGGGKQTNNPDVYGRIANNHGRGPKTKK